MVLLRSVETVTGVIASTRPAMSPAHAPNWRFTIEYSRGMDSTPAKAWGSASANPFTPRK